MNADSTYDIDTGNLSSVNVCDTSCASCNAISAVMKRRALAIACAIVWMSLGLPMAGHAAPAKPSASWRDEFGFVPVRSTKKPAVTPTAPAVPERNATMSAGSAVPVTAAVQIEKKVESVAWAALPLRDTADAGAASENRKMHEAVSSFVAQVASVSAPARQVLPSTDMTQGRHSAASDPAGTVGLAGAPQTVAASVFSQWLDDKPVDEAAHGGVADITEMQLRQRLHDAVRVASERSPNVRQAQAQWEATRYDVDTARGQRLPQIKLTGQSATRTFGGPAPSATPSLGASASLNVTTPVYDWGAASKTVRGNRQLAEAAEQGYQATLESTALDVSNTLLELGRYRRLTAIGDDYVKRMRALVDMLAQITEADKGRRSEWVQAKAQLLQAMANRDASAATVRQLEIKLRILVGDYRVDLPAEGALPISMGDLNALLADFQDHPAIRQAKATAQAAESSADAQRASKLPRVDWVVSKTAFRDAQGPQQPWATSLQLSWSLFSGGSDRSAYRAALARADASHEQMEALKRNYEYQVRDAAQTATDAFARANAYGDLSNETQQVRKAMFEQWYQLGKRSLLDVLTSETDHYNDLVGEVSNRFDAYEAVISAYDGAGKLVGWLAGGSSRR